MIEEIGRWTIQSISYMGGLFSLWAKTIIQLVLPGSPRRWRWISEQMVHAVIHSLLIVTVIMMMIGMVMALQTAYQLRQLGTELVIPGMLALSIFRELGPMITALVVAGRAGAAMTAEIGSMKVTEQIEALEAMSVKPVEFLVVPRFLAMLLLLPLLTVYADVLGIFGGYLVCSAKLGIPKELFINKAMSVVVFHDFASGIFKSVIFAMIISITCSFQGMRVSGGAGGVGRATMNAVVVSFLLIVFFDFFFTLLFYMM